MTEHQDSTTNSQTHVEGAESNADGQTPAPEGEGTGEPQNGSEGHGGSKLHREAAAYRVRAKEAESARDVLAQRVYALNRREVERLAGAAGLSMGGDLFINGNAVGDYLTESGEVDAAKVAADVAAVLAERPGLRKTVPAFDPTQGHGGVPKEKSTPAWGDLLKS